MTYREAERYFEFYRKEQRNVFRSFFKMFAFYNLESSLLANHGKEQSIRKYVRDLNREDEELPEESSIEDQFEGENFGE